MGTHPENVPYLNENGVTSPVPEEKKEGYTQCNPHPFDKEEAEFYYVKGHVLPVESGSKNLITPCHEFKSFQFAAQRSDFEQEVKFAKEVIKFAAACMNCRTNGTIHFGVEDGGAYKHGEILGVPVPKRELFVKARDKYIKKCFSQKYHHHAEHSIRPPRFVEVIGEDSGEQHFVIEVDVVPSLSWVKDKFFLVRIPDLNKSTSNQIEYTHQSCYTRKGAACEKIHKMPEYFRDWDFAREKAEREEELSRDDVYRKLSELFTSIKKHMNSKIKYILVIDHHKNNENLGFLLKMNFFCIFDFDPNSSTQDLFNLQPKAKPYFLEECVTETGSLTDEIKMNSFHQTSWIFCNGQNSNGEHKPTYNTTSRSEMRREHLANIVSQICSAVLPPGSFEVLFLLFSQANQTLAEAFHEFYTGMEGRNIRCIVEDRKIYNRWKEVLDTENNRNIHNLSIVGTKISHLDNMIQIIQSSWPTVKQLLNDDINYEDLMPYLEVLRSTDCSWEDVDPDDEEWQKEIRDKEIHFYKGGKVNWMNFWFADNKYCGEIIKRDAYEKVESHLNSLLERATSAEPVTIVTISHMPGSGGSTVARHILWDFRKRVRCATVNIIHPMHPAKTVCEHAVKLRKKEGDKVHLPVLLLVEDCDNEYIEELRINLTRAVIDYSSKPSFILLHCKRYKSAEALNNRPATVKVHYMLSENEKMQFRKKLDALKELYEEHSILTFVLMTKEFNREYLTNCVNELLGSIGQTSCALQLIRCIALLNYYVGDSYITVSQCEAFISRCVQRECAQHITFQSMLNGMANYLLEELTEISSVRIVHCKVAEEILKQMTCSQSQSKTAAKLLEESTFTKHYAAVKVDGFIRHLFVQRKDHMYRAKLSFSSFITHISQIESKNAAIDILIKACKRFDEDAFVIQQLVRFLCKEKKFEQAEKWVEKARNLAPSNSYILHTEGEMYNKWIRSKFTIPYLTEQNRSPCIFSKAIKMGLKAIDAFQNSQEASKLENEWNNAGCFGEIDVGCYIVNCMSELDIFKYKNGCYMNLVKYLLTDWIPEGLDNILGGLHEKLKMLHDNIWKTMETTYEYIAYFHPDRPTEERLPEEKYFEKLIKNEKQFSSFFTNIDDDLLRQENMEHLLPKLKNHNIYFLGGGRFMNIFPLDPANCIKIIELCKNRSANYNKSNLENYVLSHIALAVKKHPAATSKAELRELSYTLCKECTLDESPIPYFIQVLLYWPESKAENADGDEVCLIDALTSMNRLYKNKIKDSPTRKMSTYPHFFLGPGDGFQRFIHNRQRECNDGMYAWKRLCNKLQCIEGYIENQKLYIQGHSAESKIPVHCGPKYVMPSKRRQVLFYLGFTLRGCVAYNIQKVSEDH
ncbi:sterile alpha motif domain-containing protein 9-like isoform X2 [Hypanus sabinus]|nr:sterile alpha motif domain-containing protein 9-like isoform X2 [Hypanus sabinus]XP_059804242.1 sterile alpha motif domain-containing protein 9-like isoform X2 [Hypanus sabinus]XP_059804243.1 sterile alpha motif domain-containing protein 9-like isoform X2 [Hypanus sabinus]XP_059804244.1 sterile alpha motif domain-containing protein 9-like isoform X2 [Hypanus sabinus]XP_059804246.1 sterile alpha motif domain-containing protein 9-like isoform X2 [Hypanus sabinus]XP_059804247.1 sterile alpha m